VISEKDIGVGWLLVGLNTKVADVFVGFGRPLSVGGRWLMSVDSSFCFVPSHSVNQL
jgi:hypothetical protein